MNIKKRGFALMSKEKRHLVAAKGGKAAHKKGTAHKFNHEEAVRAGRLGGLAGRKKFE